MGCNSSQAANPQKKEKQIEDLSSYTITLGGNAKNSLMLTPSGSKTFAFHQNNPRATHSPSFTAIAEEVSRKQSMFSSQSESETDTPGKLSKLSNLEHFRKKTQEAKSCLQRFLKRASYLEGIMENISKNPKGTFISSVFEAPLAENSPEEKLNSKSKELVLLLEDLQEINSVVNILNQKFTTINTGINKLLIRDDGNHNNEIEAKEETKKCENEIDEKGQKEEDLINENAENNEIVANEILKDESEETKAIGNIISNFILDPIDLKISSEEINEKNENTTETPELPEEAIQEQHKPSENVSVESASEKINKSRIIATKLFNVTTKQPGKSRIGLRPKIEIDSLSNNKSQVQPIVTPKRNSDISSKLPQCSTPTSKSIEEPKKFHFSKSSSQISQAKPRSSVDAISLNAFGALKKQVEAEVDQQKTKSRIQKVSFGNSHHQRSLSSKSNN